LFLAARKIMITMQEYTLEEKVHGGLAEDPKTAKFTDPDWRIWVKVFTGQYYAPIPVAPYQAGLAL
jgi:hypothetical protein